MTLWRISNHVDLSGEGGRRSSARWHSAGVPVVYLTSNPASALLEVLAQHVPLGDVPDSFQWLEIALDSKLLISTPPALEPDWRTNVTVTREIGNVWLRDRPAAMLEVPSALVPKTSNYLLNPRHPDAHRLRIASVMRYPLDSRLAGSVTH